jgi:hypothetical protein
MLFPEIFTKNRSLGTCGRDDGQHDNGQPAFLEDADTLPFSEELFTKLLCLERKRAERSRKPFGLMLISADPILRADDRDRILTRLANALFLSTRETDICGWYKKGSVVGAILTEIGSADTNALRHTMLAKLHRALEGNLEPSLVENIHISLHVFPEEPGSSDG